MKRTTSLNKRIICRHTRWKKWMRCQLGGRLVLASFLTAAILVFPAAPSYAGGGTGAGQPAKSVTSAKAERVNPSPAMLISLAFGLRNATGPIVDASRHQHRAAATRESPSTIASQASSRNEESGGYALATGPSSETACGDL